jgi:hypothetical protein
MDGQQPTGTQEVTDLTGEEVHLDAPLAEWGLREVVEYMFEVEQTVRKLAKLLGYVAVDGAEFRQTE